MRKLSVVKIIVILALLSGLNLRASDSLRRKMILKTDLIPYIPNFLINTGKANLEMEIPLKKNNSYAVDVGWLYSYGATHKSWLSYEVDQKSTYGFSVNYERRRYFNKSKVWEPLCLLIWPLVFQLHSQKKDNTGIYLSGKVGYRHTFSEIPAENGSHYIHRFNPSVLFKLGFQSISTKRICVDQSLGLGGQYVSSFSGTMPVNNFNSLVFSEDKKHFWPMITYSFKIGFEL